MHDVQKCLRCRQRRRFNGTIQSSTTSRHGWTEAGSIQELMDRLQQKHPGEQLLVQLYDAEGVEETRRDAWLL
jgi:hypothetical protein